MATLERGRSAERVLHAVGEKAHTSDPSQSAVPTPFPATQAAKYTNASDERTDSRSPSGTRRASLSRGVGGIMDKVKRAMSASRERSTSGGDSYRAASRGRRESVDSELGFFVSR
ncbi:hypothetical protein BCR35DRAFT_151723 [Leucosporidium creatinivorum]|uniref:Uncharacterized protein n=1 Tax=Leucosporidium creatinivorum TaxID=106004 RepID=A0A1Y2ENE2_9BASI|nr:hypothetical protein BCR35DRAFT_151723 [Leucosporidium creatinivorum]